MSLIYSDYLGKPAPCGLFAGFPEDFYFSQVILFAVAYIKNDLKVFTYTFWLSVVGGVIAIYHEWLQVGYNELIRVL